MKNNEVMTGYSNGQKKVKICPYCGEEILAVAKKCKHCGEWLDKETETEPAMVECPVCGEQIEESADICPFCKEKVKDEKETSVPSIVETKDNAGGADENNIQPLGDVAKPYGDEECNQCVSDNIAGFFKYSFADVFIRHYADFKGKISRKQFWLGYLSYSLLIFSLVLVDFLAGTYYVFVSIAALLLTVPGLAFMVRRLHDINKSGWWIFISMIPLVGYLWLFVLLLKRGETKSPKIKLMPVDWAIFSGILILIISVIVSFRSMTSDIFTGNGFSYDNYNEEQFDSEDYSGTKYYEGVIDGKYYCDIELLFNCSSGGMPTVIYWVEGSYSYRKSKSSDRLLLYGSYDPSSFKMELGEYLNNPDEEPIGNISACRIGTGEFSGTYYSAHGEEMEFYMKEK